MVVLAPGLAAVTFAVMPLMVIAVWIFTEKAKVAYRRSRVDRRHADRRVRRVVRRRAGGPGVCARGFQHRALRRGQQRQPAGQHPGQHAVVDAAAGGRAVQRGGHRGGDRLRRLADGQRRRHAGRARRVPGLHHALLPADPHADPVLQPAPGRYGRRREGVRAAGRAGDDHRSCQPDHAGAVSRARWSSATWHSPTAASRCWRTSASTPTRAR